MSETIESRFREAARAHAGRLAVADGTVDLTFAELAAAAEAGAAALAREGLRAHEPVLVPVSNRAADVAAFLAVQRAGGVAVPLHRAMPEGARAALIARLGARLAMEDAPRRLADAPPPERPLLEGAGTVIFTSGSTGAPKGVVLSATRAAAKLRMIEAMTGWRPGESALVGLQLTFSFGQWATWATLLNGGAAHLRARFDPAEYRARLEGGDVSRFPAVPTMLRHLLAAGGAPGFAGRIMAGGEPLPAALGAQVRAAMPEAGLGDIFGLTETGTCDLFVPPGEYDRLAGTLGRPGEGIEARIDPESRELQIRSPWRMLGYLDAPDLTEAAFADGWFRTGDLAEAAGDGALRLIGRAKDLIVRAGNKIAPLEVEGVFLRHPSVAAALAAGVADPERGEALHLALVLRPGAGADADALRAFAAEHLERFKLPDAIHFMEELPAGATGKADRAGLRARIEGARASA